MAYLAHLRDDGHVQLLREHLFGTAERAASYASAFGEGAMGRFVGMFHDIGKYSEAFQRYLRGEGGGRGSVDHATFGANEIFSCGNRENAAQVITASMCIAGHHAGLADFGTQVADGKGSTFMDRMKRKDLPDARAFRTDGLPEMEVPSLSETPVLQEIKKSAEGQTKDRWRAEFSVMAYTRMLYSCLVDADFLDTEAFMQDDAAPERGGFPSLRELAEKVDAYLARFGAPTTEINRRRTEILRQCIAAGDQAAHRLRTLAVPTGGGKTIASLAFAMHTAMARPDVRRIIYVIPYTSIIEQTADVFRGIVGKDAVLEHHHQVDWDDPEHGGDRKRLASENWDAPLIVTTNVQFFESLFACRTSHCRKLHNIAGSVIIFDEAQMIPTGYLQPSMEAVRELTEQYGCTAVFCTATQPSLGAFFPGNPPVEIATHRDEDFAFFRRTRIVQDAGETSPVMLADRLEENGQVLVIVNRKSRAGEVYDLLPEEGRYYLTTNLYPAHRRRVLREIRARLAAGKVCRVVATSLVEAGVDFDFPVVYREMAGLDNIIQAAGRCNREGKRALDESLVHVFSFGDPAPSYIRLQSAIASKVLAKYPEDPGAPQAIAAYFEELHMLRNTDAKEIGRLVTQEKFPFRKIADAFHFIDEDTVTLLVLAIQDKEERKEAERIAEALRYGTASRTLMRRAGQYAVSVYRPVYRELLDAGKVEPVEGAEDFAILVDDACYDDEKGLLEQVPTGQADFF